MTEVTGGGKNEMTERDDFFFLEQQNSRRIEKLEASFSELREDVAAMPGRIVSMLEDRNTGHSDANRQHLYWAFGLFVTMLGAVAWNMNSQDNDIKNQLHSHTKDGHPYTVLAEVGSLREKVTAGAKKLGIIESDQKEFDMKSSYDRGLVFAEIESLKQSDVISKETHGLHSTKLAFLEALVEKIAREQERRTSRVYEAEANR